jgi:hypothetical protein
MRQLTELERAILENVGRREKGRAGYTAVEIDGYDADAIDEAVHALARDGLLEARYVRPSLGPNRPTLHPRTLTDKGRRLINAAAV